jgi:hypothetical protein
VSSCFGVRGVEDGTQDGDLKKVREEGGRRKRRGRGRKGGRRRIKKGGGRRKKGEGGRREEGGWREDLKAGLTKNISPHGRCD